jgi:hypothetical protein
VLNVKHSVVPTGTLFGAQQNSNYLANMGEFLGAPGTVAPSIGLTGSSFGGGAQFAPPTTQTMPTVFPLPIGPYSYPTQGTISYTPGGHPSISTGATKCLPNDIVAVSSISVDQLMSFEHA